MKLIPLLFPWLIEKKIDQANSIAYFFSEFYMNWFKVM